MTSVGSGGFEPLLDPSTPQTPPLGERRGSFDRLRTVVEGDLLPRLLLAHQAGPIPPRLAARAKQVLPGEDFEAFLDLLTSRTSDDELVGFIQARLSLGHTPEAVYDDLLTPAARDLGVRWEEDECDFVEVTLLCCQMQRVVRRLSRRMAATGNVGTRGTVLVMGLPDEQHTLGAILIAEVLSGDGWSVALGEPFDRNPDPKGIGLLAFSLSRADRWEAAREQIFQVRRRVGPELQVMVGGSAFIRDPKLIMKVGADGWAEDGKAVKALADRLCPEDSATADA